MQSEQLLLQIPQSKPGFMRVDSTRTLKFGIQRILNESNSSIQSAMAVPVTTSWTPPPPLTLSTSLSPSSSSSLSPSTSLPPHLTVFFPFSSTVPVSSGLSSGDSGSPTLENDIPYDLSLSGKTTGQRAQFLEFPRRPDCKFSQDLTKSDKFAKSFGRHPSVNVLNTLIVDDLDNEPDEEGRPSYTSSRLTASSSRVDNLKNKPIASSITSQMEQDLLRALDTLTASSTTSSGTPSLTCPSTKTKSSTTSAAAAAAAAVVAAATLVGPESTHHPSRAHAWSVMMLRGVSPSFTFPKL